MMVWLAALFAAFFILSLLFVGTQVVPQSQEYVIERFGKYSRTLRAGLSFIVPFLDRVSFKVVIIERHLPEFTIRVITSDNVEAILSTAIFYRIIDSAKSRYRIDDVESALSTTTESVVRSCCGRLDLDSVQISRDHLNTEIADTLRKAAHVWGVEITRTEVTDVELDEQTRDAQRLQLNADRERRAVISKAEGHKKTVELEAEANLYKALKEAEAIKIKADADAYRIERNAEASAKQTELIASAIGQENGSHAVEREIRLTQANSLAALGQSENSKVLVIPSDITRSLGTLETVVESLRGRT